jgi:hypothetical protein
MKRILFALFALAAVASAACRQYDVDVYRNVNGRVWGPDGVSQSFTCTADSLLWVEFFVGAANTQGSGNSYYMEARDLATNELVYSASKLVKGQHYEYVRFDTLQFFNSLVKGEEYVLKVTIPNSGQNESLNYYYDPTNPYPYGEMTIPGNTQPLYWDLCARIEGINRPVSRESAEKPVSQPDLSIDSVWVTQGANAQATLHARVRNMGAREFASAKKGCWVQFAIDGDSVGAIAGPAKLNAGSIALVQSVSVSPDRSIMHLVSAIANPDKEVTEPNFDNNARYCPLFAR